MLRQILQLALGLDTAQTNYVCIGSASIVEPINEGDIDTGSKGGVIVTLSFSRARCENVLKQPIQCDVIGVIDRRYINAGPNANCDIAWVA